MKKSPSDSVRVSKEEKRWKKYLATCKIKQGKLTDLEIAYITERCWKYLS